MSRLKTVAYYAAQALTVALILTVSLQLWEKDLRVPFQYQGDTILFTVIVKAVTEGGGLRFGSLGMPFGMDLADWPIGMLFDWTVLRTLNGLVGSPGAALNLYWLLSLVGTGLAATFAFHRLGFDRVIAFGLGVLYTTTPYAFYRNVAHISLVFHFIPLIALLCLEITGGAAVTGRTGRAVTLIACALQGLGIAYYAFFACFLLLCAGVLGWLTTKRWEGPRLAGAAILVIMAATVADVSPSLLYWREHGRNPELQYKTAADADVYGVKIRELLTPIADHPLAPFRELAARVAAAHAGRRESATNRLGTLGALGFLILLGFVVGASAGLFPASPPALRSAAALNLAALLLAMVGGFGSLFSVFVTPDIRAYNRIVVFVAFFSLVALGTVLLWVKGRLTPRLPAPLVGTGLLLVLLLGVFDQAATQPLTARYALDDDDFRSEERFVRRLESLMPAGAMIFQLPYAPMPLDPGSERMGIYDHGRAYVHSRSLRWSWGAISGRHGNWQRETARLEPQALVRRVALAGFDGVWIDRLGYEEGASEPLEAALSRATAVEAVVSDNERWVFLSLVALRHELEAELGREGYARAHEAALRPFLAPRFGEGCHPVPDDGREVWRTCQNGAWAVLKNGLEGERRVLIEVRLRTASGEEAALQLESFRFHDAIRIGRRAVDYRRELTLLPGEKVRITFRSPVAFQIADLAATVRPTGTASAQ